MSSYLVAAGDTFALISRKVYGVETFAQVIQAANPGASEPLVTGTTLTVPPNPSAPTNTLASSSTNGPDEVALLLDNERFRFWDGVRITRSFDSFDTIEFSAPFDPDDADQREKFRPFSYGNASFSVGGEPLFTGTVVSVRPELTPNSRTVRVGGYSKPGVLNDCTPSPDTKLEFNDVALPEIAPSLILPFGLEIEFLANPGSTFERVACDSTRKVLSFLTELAQQRNGVFNSSPAGVLRFMQSEPAGVPVATLEEGVSPLLEVLPNFSEQNYYSHITGVERVGTGTAGSRFTVTNSRVSSVRPFTFAVTDAIGGDVQTATQSKMGRMFGSAISYSVTVATWRAENGQLWAPDQTVSLLAPSAMVYSPYKFKIRNVTFDASKTERTATLELVLPGAFSGEIPEALPWD